MDVNKAIDKQALGLVGVNRGRGEINFGGWTGRGYYITDGSYDWGSPHPEQIGPKNTQWEWATSQPNTSGYPICCATSIQSCDGFGDRYDYGETLENYGATYDLTSTDEGPIRSNSRSIRVS